MSLALLAKAWEELALREDGFTCTQAAEASKEVVGGTVFGYWHDDNPTAKLGESEGGHDFLVVDEWLLDFWAAAYYKEQPVHNLQTDAVEIARLYGDRSKWETIEKRPKGPRFID